MSEKEWKINQLFELNITTQNIQKYFSGLQPQNMDIQGNKILADKDNLLLGKYSQYLNIVDILILTLVLQPKKFIVYVQNFIKSQGLGCIFQNSQFNFQEILRNSDSVHPILFLMGEDPLSRITDFFTKKKIKNIIIISMGEGQQSLAETVLERQWMKQTMVIIHNIHICPSIFPLLTKTIEQFSFSGYNRQPHKNFRLILISENVETLPSQLVGSCQKYLIGQPGGINKRMISLYTKIAKKHIDLRKQQDLNRIVYSLCLLHSLINQIDNYPPYGWNLKYNFTIQDFIHGIKTIKEIHGQSNISQDSNSEYLRCNIEIQQLKKMKKNTIDLQSLKYGVGEINYLGKIADQMDKQKMLTLIDRHFSQAFLYNKQNVQGKWSFKIPQNQNQTYIEISKLQQKNPVMFDLHESIQHRQEIPKYYLGYISQLFLRDKRNTDAESEALGKSQYKQIENLNELENIEHKISFINQSFTEFNEKIVDIKKNIGNINRKVYQKTLEHYKLLSSISSQSNSFSLKSFNSPRKLFSSIKMDMAAKLKVQFQSISIMWSVGINLGKGQNVYAITDIKLQGANINNGILIDGKQQTGLVLYFWPIHLKKNKAQIISNKYKVKIPLYFKQQRSGRINSFGENTNLLTMIGIESKERQQFWTLRSTAFVADYK